MVADRFRSTSTRLVVTSAVVLLGGLLPGIAVAAPAPGPSGRLTLTVEVPAASPSASEPVTSAPEPSPTVPAEDEGGGGSLPRTGMSVVAIVVAGVALLTVGIGARRAGRRRR